MFVMKCSASVFKLSIEVDVAGEALAVLPHRFIDEPSAV
jgi:hypothetical protein